MISEKEKQEIEKAVLERIAAERRAYKKAWREKNRESVKRSNDKYYAKKKAERDEGNSHE